MTNCKITLYSYVTSPYAMKVHCYLLYKKLNFNIVYVNPFRVKKILPIGRQIPVVSIDGESKSNSSDIGRWLDEKFPDFGILTPNNYNQIVMMDHWITEHLIPSVFYLIYPQINRFLFQNISNSIRLGYCIKNTTNDNLYGMHLLWALFIHRADFIRRILKPLRMNISAIEYHNEALKHLNMILDKQQFLASPDNPTMADLSAWPQLVIPYRLRLKGVDRFKNYNNINRWINDMEPYLNEDKAQPPLIPEILNPKLL